MSMYNPVFKFVNAFVETAGIYPVTPDWTKIMMGAKQKRGNNLYALTEINPPKFETFHAEQVSISKYIWEFLRSGQIDTASVGKALLFRALARVAKGNLAAYKKMLNNFRYQEIRSPGSTLGMGVDRKLMAPVFFYNPEFVLFFGITGLLSRCLEARRGKGRENRYGGVSYSGKGKYEHLLTEDTIADAVTFVILHECWHWARGHESVHRTKAEMEEDRRTGKHGSRHTDIANIVYDADINVTLAKVLGDVCPPALLAVGIGQGTYLNIQVTEKKLIDYLNIPEEFRNPVTSFIAVMVLALTQKVNLSYIDSWFVNIHRIRSEFGSDATIEAFLEFEKKIADGPLTRKVNILPDVMKEALNDLRKRATKGVPMYNVGDVVVDKNDSYVVGQIIKVYDGGGKPGLFEYDIAAFDEPVPQLSKFEITCPACSREMKKRRNSKTGKWFYGCRGWPLHCKATLELDDPEVLKQKAEREEKEKSNGAPVPKWRRRGKELMKVKPAEFKVGDLVQGADRTVYVVLRRHDDPDNVKDPVGISALRPYVLSDTVDALNPFKEIGAHFALIQDTQDVFVGDRVEVRGRGFFGVVSEVFYPTNTYVIDTSTDGVASVQERFTRQQLRKAKPKQESAGFQPGDYVRIPETGEFGVVEQVPGQPDGTYKVRIFSNEEWVALVEAEYKSRKGL